MLPMTINEIVYILQEVSAPIMLSFLAFIFLCRGQKWQNRCVNTQCEVKEMPVNGRTFGHAHVVMVCFPASEALDVLKTMLNVSEKTEFIYIFSVSQHWFEQPLLPRGYATLSDSSTLLSDYKHKNTFQSWHNNVDSLVTANNGIVSSPMPIFMDGCVQDNGFPAT